MAKLKIKMFLMPPYFISMEPSALVCTMPDSQEYLRRSQSTKKNPTPHIEVRNFLPDDTVLVSALLINKLQVSQYLSMRHHKSQNLVGL